MKNKFKFSINFYKVQLVREHSLLSMRAFVSFFLHGHAKKVVDGMAILAYNSGIEIVRCNKEKWHNSNSCCAIFPNI